MDDSTSTSISTSISKLSSLLLSKEQKNLLNLSIIQYLINVEENKKNKNNDNNTQIIQDVCKLLDIETNKIDTLITNNTALGDDYLIRKWCSIVRLQKKIINLEKQLYNNGTNNTPNINNNNNKIWLPSSQFPTHQIVLGNNNTSISSLKLHPKAPLIFIGCEDGSLHCYNLINTSIPILYIPNAHMKGVTRIDISINDNDTTSLATVSKDLFLKTWEFTTTTNDTQNMPTLKPIWQLSGHENIISCVKFHNIGASNNASIVSTCSRDSTIRSYDLDNGWLINQNTKAHLTWCRCIDVYLHFIVSGSNDCTISLSHCLINSALHFNNLKFHDLPITDIKLFKHNSVFYILSCSRDCTIKLWELPINLENYSNTTTDIITDLFNKNMELKLINTYKGHSSWVKQLAYHITVSNTNPPQGLIYSCSDDSTIKVWDMLTGDILYNNTSNFHNKNFINCLQVDYHRKIICSGGIDGKVNIFI
ncbi:uncharacterized protein SCODWIG_00082 [Saccharomycodes ludwigii]|uniref:Uncharacterized protein n=1 Tax=Saccharomycodes ludwigii TaxID=36035 RepID=A0A376B115_9ASCO|nr:uncharacterized protein SCODWIG_00082 [Saccharomycodes ludwigii]